VWSLVRPPFSLRERDGMRGSENQNICLSNSLTQPLSLGERRLSRTAE